MKLKHLKKLVAVSAVLMVSGCSAKKVDLASFQVTPEDKIEASHTLPQYVIDAKKPRIAILPGVNKSSSKQCKIQDGITTNVTNVLANTGAYTVVERAQVKTLMNEVKFAAGLGGGIDATKLQKLAKQLDFAVLVSGSEASTHASFTEASSWTDDKGQVHNVAPYCTVKGRVKVTAKIVAFPSGEIKKVIQQDGIQTNTYDVRSSYNCKVSDPCGILDTAVGLAVDEAKEELASSAPVYGYIYKMRSGDGERVASITLGINNGVEAGSNMEIIQFDSEFDPIKKKNISVSRVIGKCEVAETDLNADRALCVLDDEHMKNIHLKHAVLLLHEKSMWGEMKSAKRGLDSLTF